MHMQARIRYTGILPTYATPGSSGADLYADIEKDLVLEPHQSTLVSTGTTVEIPEGYEGQVRPRSGLSFRHGIIILNSPGTIDADYRGVIQVPLFNISRTPYILKPRERIAQLVIHAVVHVQFEQVSEPADLSATQRGTDGFGASGKF